MASAAPMPDAMAAPCADSARAHVASAAMRPAMFGSTAPVLRHPVSERAMTAISAMNLMSFLLWCWLTARVLITRAEVRPQVAAERHAARRQAPEALPVWHEVRVGVILV